jgi:hypothetical protein
VQRWRLWAFDVFMQLSSWYRTCIESYINAIYKTVLQLINIKSVTITRIKILLISIRIPGAF